MYEKAFYIKTSTGNNQIGFEARKTKKLFVPSLITVKDWLNIELGEEIVFGDIDFNGILQEKTGLKNFFVGKWNNIPLYLFDNHNHAFYFWYEARSKGIISHNNFLVHIDQHSDMRDPGEYLTQTETVDLHKVFDYTQYVLNVGNYIIPAIKEGIISEIVSIRNEDDVKNYLQKIEKNKKNVILNLDLDFFSPELDYINYQEKKEMIRNIASQSKLITVATSPFFIDQNLAIQIFKDIFFNQP